jgi:hypothetical protein
MTPERWAQIKELFGTARQRPEEERAGWLDSACGGNDILRAEVEQLLAAAFPPLFSFFSKKKRAAVALGLSLVREETRGDGSTEQDNPHSTRSRHRSLSPDDVRDAMMRCPSGDSRNPCTRQVRQTMPSGFST